MASTIKIKRSGVSGKQPNTASLSVGELAINYKDQKLYSSNGTAVFEIGKSGTISSLTTKTLDSLVGTDTVVVGAQSVAASNYLQVANAFSSMTPRSANTAAVSTIASNVKLNDAVVVNPAGHLQIVINGVTYKIPYFL